jgi:DNA-binding transcriptional LysR family regulator
VSSLCKRSTAITCASTRRPHLLMPDFAEFGRRRPEVEMEIVSSYEPANLTNREAEVAIFRGID